MSDTLCSTTQKMPQYKSLVTNHQHIHVISIYSSRHILLCVVTDTKQVIYRDLQRERGKAEVSKIMFAVGTLENTNNMTINDYFNGICLLLYRSCDV